jgi:uncharacterized protein (DUF433 family)
MAPPVGPEPRSRTLSPRPSNGSASTPRSWEDPCIRGTRIPVAMIVRMVADGTTSDELLEYPQLTADDIREALRFAATHVDQRTIALDHST